MKNTVVLYKDNGYEPHTYITSFCPKSRTEVRSLFRDLIRDGFIPRRVKTYNGTNLLGTNWRDDVYLITRTTKKAGKAMLKNQRAHKGY